MRRFSKALGSRFWRLTSPSIARRWDPNRWWMGAFGVLAFSCMPQSQPVAPQVPPSQVLNLADQALNETPAFSIVHSAPVGATNNDPSVQLVFSRPLHALGVDVPPPSTIQLIPEVPGHWEWVGVHGLTFVPSAGRLPRATSFEVNVPGSLRAQDGSPLGQDTRFSFTTPRPSVESAYPDQLEASHLPRQVIELNFS